MCDLGTKVNLLGSDAKEKALVDQWVHFSEQEIGSPAHNAMGVIYGFGGPFNREVGVKTLTYCRDDLTIPLLGPRQAGRTPEARPGLRRVVPCDAFVWVFGHGLGDFG